MEKITLNNGTTLIIREVFWGWEVTTEENYKALISMNKANLTSEFREGIKCQFCGEKISPFDFLMQNVVKADGGCKGSVIYAHLECCDKKNYSYKNLVRNRKKTYSGFQWGSEFETNDETTNEQRLQLFSWYKLVCTHDCTVAEEFKSGINQGLHGTKKYLEGIEKIIDISSGANCGTHANVSLASWENSSAMSWVYNYSTTLFRPLAQAIRNLPEQKRIEIFGRDFGDYRHYTEEEFEHGDWLQIKNNCLEFRISRYRNATQYSHLLMLYKEFCLVIDKIFLANPCTETAIQTANKMVVLLNKHSQGKATYQRKERNQ